MSRFALQHAPEPERRRGGPSLAWVSLCLTLLCCTLIWLWAALQG